MRLAPYCGAWVFVLLGAALSPAADRSLVVHYTFDEPSAEVATDLSTYGNSGKIAATEHLDELEGRRGVLRFDGKQSLLTCPDAESLRFGGDMTFELRVRLNGTVMDTWAMLFGDDEDFAFYFAGFDSLVLWYANRDPLHGTESMLVPVDKTILGPQWSHIAVVVEYPRCRFYCNGKLVRDAYMPIPGIANNINKPFLIGRKMPMDLDEFSLYRRALSAEEVAAHAQGKERPPQAVAELAVEPHWYERTVTLRLSCKGAEYAGRSAQFALEPGDRSAKAVELAESSPGSGRYVASAAFPLAGLENRTVKAAARLVGADGKPPRDIAHQVSLTKPEWVDTKEGSIERVPAPWTPIQAAEKADGTAEVNVWGRRYVFGKGLLPEQIETGREQLLTSPISLTARADGKPIAWGDKRPPQLKQHTDAAATLQQASAGDPLAVSVETSIEFDGYMIFDCQVKAQRDTSLEELTVDIPLKSRYAALCYGDRVLPPNDEVPIREFYSGAVRGDLGFRFSPTIWLGDEQRGLCWQAETDQDWHSADRQKAIEILPRGEMTTFQAHLVDQPTRLEAGKTLHYQFALQATPIKPLERDAWDLRIMRSEPYGKDLGLPDRTMNGKPEIEYLREMGLRHLFTMVCDLWPYSLPVNENYARLLRRLNDAMHAQGLKIYNYQIHERFATMAPEFDIHGLHMAQRPMNQYLPANSPPGDPRPGEVGVEYGSNSQGTVFACPKSMAFQDACVSSLGRRLDQYGDDGVYLDGTGQCPPCQNLEHGCGYRLADGTIRKTYPVFAIRKFMQRIYVTVKRRNPDNVVDVHCSWGYNPPALGYADVMWTGEQWWHLRGTHAKHIPTELPLEMFRTEFLGTQIGIAAETLAYRLGPQMKVAAISLLHDVPVRASDDGLDQQVKTRAGSDENYTQVLVKLWRLRDQFGAKQAQKLFYWQNSEYVRASPGQCYATLLKHPSNGVLAFISNLHPDAQTVTLRLDLAKLGLSGRKLTAFNPLTQEPIALDANGTIALPLGSLEWAYIWVRPDAAP